MPGKGNSPGYGKKDLGRLLFANPFLAGHQLQCVMTKLNTRAESVNQQTVYRLAKIPVGVGKSGAQTATLASQTTTETSQVTYFTQSAMVVCENSACVRVFHTLHSCRPHFGPNF